MYVRNFYDLSKQIYRARLRRIRFQVLGYRAEEGTVAYSPNR